MQLKKKTITASNYFFSYLVALNVTPCRHADFLFGSYKFQQRCMNQLHNHKRLTQIFNFIPILLYGFSSSLIVYKLQELLVFYQNWLVLKIVYFSDYTFLLYYLVLLIGQLLMSHLPFQKWRKSRTTTIFAFHKGAS